MLRPRRRGVEQKGKRSNKEQEKNVVSRMQDPYSVPGVVAKQQQPPCGLKTAVSTLRDHTDMAIGARK
jgi:hypothetical protein